MSIRIKNNQILPQVRDTLAGKNWKNIVILYKEKREKNKILCISSTGG